MKFNKKGAELSLNIIIIAILVLLVLVVISLVFTNKLGSFRKASETCAAQNGACVDASECVGEYQKVITGTCNTIDAEGKQVIDTDSVCCLRVG